MDSGALRDSARGAVLSNCRFTDCLWLASMLKHDRGEDPVATVIVGRRGISLFTRNTNAMSNNYVLYKSDNISSPLFHFSSYS